MMKIISYTQSMEEQGVDRVSDLPVGILHNILSFLPLKDAPKINLLSKRWQYVWDSYPVFKFFSPDETENIGIMERYADMFDCRLQKFCKLNFSIHKVLFFITDGVAPEFNSRLDNWMGLILDKQVKELDFYISSSLEIDYSLPQTVFASRSLTVLTIRGINLELNDERISMNVPSLRTLHPNWVNMSDKTIQHLISSCPSLEDLELSNCRGLEELTLSGMVKLHTIKLGWINRVKLSNFRALKKASFCGIELDCIFDDLHFPQIEFIFLWYCTFPRRFKICSHQLKNIVSDYRNLDNHDIIAPNLSSVRLSCSDFKGKSVLKDLDRALTSISKLHGQYKLTVSVTVDGEILGTVWFIKLKESLQLHTPTKTLNLCIRLGEDFQTNKIELDEASSSYSPPFTLEHMTLAVDDSKRRTNQIDFAAILDGFLWCCHPNTLLVDIDFKLGSQFLKFLFETLEEERENQVCCSSSNKIKCWHHALKNLKVVILDTLDEIKSKLPVCREALSKAFENDGIETVFWRIHINLSW